MSKKQKLELTWIGKDEETKLEPRILIEDPDKSYGAKDAQNMLIHGDNLLALKALEQNFAGKIKCIYIDPPYNTGAAFESYDDGQEHSIWLSLMKSRLEALWKLLTTENGTLLISINDDECHYLKVLCDELFGRNCFVASLVWNYEGNTDNQAKIINYHEYVLIYSKSGEVDYPEIIDPNIQDTSKLFKNEIRNTIVKNGPKNPPKTVRIPSGFPCNFNDGKIEKDQVEWPKYDKDILVNNSKTQEVLNAKTGWSSRAIFEKFIENNFRPVLDSKGQETIFEMTKTGAIEAVKKRIRKKGHFLSVLRGFGTTNQMRIMLSKLGIKFTYPKPVELISYLIEAFTGPNDCILDSFVGSGTTAHAVLKINNLRKSSRKFIVVEFNKSTVENVILPRLKAIILGNKQAKLEASGGGFKFYELAPSLLKKDKYDNWIIDERYNADMLAAAMAKHEGFKYSPSEDLYWKQGQSTEKDFIFTTTQMMTAALLDRIAEEMKPDESLLICCKSYQKVCENKYPNISIKKIPNMLLGRCEFGKEDYSLNIIDMPHDEDELDFIPIGPEEKRKQKKKKEEDNEPSLF